jgi:3-oxoacyl-[acyl-carrier protein] reductase
VELAGQVAVVTGGSRGIGRAIAVELARAGARVVIGYRSGAADAAAVAAEIDGIAVQADVAATAGCEALVAAAEAVGPVRILVNNAGMTADGLAMRMSDAQWDDVLSVNAGGSFRMARAVLPAMVRRRDGVIINLASVSALRGNPGQANYAASKAAVLALTRTLAREVGRRGVRVNAVVPGFIDTDMTRGLPDAVLEGAKEQIPLRRLGLASEIAPMVRFLCGPGASYVTGQSFVIDGGLSA